jgi:hypothetical protein
VKPELLTSRRKGRKGIGKAEYASSGHLPALGGLSPLEKVEDTEVKTGVRNFSLASTGSRKPKVSDPNLQTGDPIPLPILKIKGICNQPGSAKDFGDGVEWISQERGQRQVSPTLDGQHSVCPQHEIRQELVAVQE